MPIRHSYTKTHFLERELSAPVTAHLRERGFGVVLPELRFFDRGVDLYGFNSSRPRKSIAVELKLTNWRRALQQAAVYQLCADFSYVAMPIRNALNLELTAFKQCGVGVLLVRRDNTVGELLQAKQSTEVRRDYAEALIRMAMEVAIYARQ